MSYIFPRRRLRDPDVLDPIELTQDLSPAAERLSGRLNAHNFNENISSTVDLEPEAVTDTWIYRLAVPFGDLHPATALEPWTGMPDELVPAVGTANEDAYLVQNTFEWQAIADVNGATAVVTVDTGSAVLWVHAFAQYLWYGFQLQLDSPADYPNWQHASNADERGVNLQFAIRFDGSVLEDTITGIDDPVYQASMPLKPLIQRDTTAANTPLPGPQDIRSPQICAIGPAAGGPRISACIPVQAGEHTIEIVVRRVPLYVIAGNYTAGEVVDSMPEYTSVDNVYIMSRQVIVTELKTFPVDSVVSADLSVPAFEEEDPVSNTTMYVERVQPLIAAYNDVAEGNLQRGALMHYHLPNVLRDQDTERAVLTTAFPGELYNCVYPGFSSATIASAKYDAATPKVGWFMITDGTQDIMVKNISIALQRRMLVMANLQIVDIDGSQVEVYISGGPPSTVNQEYCGGFAVFRLMWRVTGTGNQAWQPLTESTAMVNSYSWKAASRNQPYEFAEVMLQAEFPIGPLAATTIDIAVFGAVMNGNDGTLNPNQQKTEFAVKRGSIVALSLRD
jgi:hypothetical protein